MLPVQKGGLGVPDYFEMIESRTWRSIEQDQTRSLIGVGNIRTNIFTVVVDPSSKVSYLGNFELPNMLARDQKAFAGMIEAISGNNIPDRMSAFVGGAALTERRTPDGIEVDEVIAENRDFVISSLSAVLPERAIFDRWSAIDEVVVFAGLVPGGKFAVVSSSDSSD